MSLMQYLDPALRFMGGVGNLLDLPGSSLRDLLTGNNPFDQWATPFSDENRATGRDVLEPILGANEETGMSGWLSNPMEGVKDVAGFGAEMLLDPMNLVTGSGVAKALRGRKAAKAYNAAAAAENLANNGRYGMVNAKLLADDMVGELANPITGEAPQKLLGYTPEPETVFHGGRDWSASATPDHPYGVFDTGRLKTGEGNNAYGPGMYVADAQKASESYKQRIDDLDSEPNPVKMAELSSKIDGVLPQGKEIAADEMNFHSPLSDLYYLADDTAHSYGGNKSVFGVRITGKTPDGSYLYDVKVDDGVGGFEYIPGDVPYQPKIQWPEWADHLGVNVDYVEPKGVLYQLDMPAGSKDRFMNWDAGMTDQPNPVKNLIDEHPLGQYARKKQTYDTEMLRLNNLMREARIKAGAHPGDWQFRNDEINSLRDQYNAISAEAEAAGKEVQNQFGHRVRTGNWLADGAAKGSDVVDLVMGNQASSASLNDVLKLREAGVPGMKNLSHASKGSYNYAIWDQDLIDQMRVRAINGERVPINPTTLVTQQEVQTFRAKPSNDDLISAVNPMKQLQKVPSATGPAAQMVLYNILARQRGPGSNL